LSLDVPANLNHLELPLSDVSLFQNLQAGHSKFKDAMTLFQKRNQADMAHMQASVKHLIKCFLTSHMALCVCPSTNLFFKEFSHVVRTPNGPELMQDHFSGQQVVQNANFQSGHATADFGKF